MEFEINGTKWAIEIVNETKMHDETENRYTLGLTIYKSQKIYLLQEHANIIRTLKHELMHVWLYEYGHAQDDDFSYNAEDICEIVASSNTFVNEVVYKFLKAQKPQHEGKHEKNEVIE